MFKRIFPSFSSSTINLVPGKSHSSTSGGSDDDSEQVYTSDFATIRRYSAARSFPTTYLEEDTMINDNADLSIDPFENSFVLRRQKSEPNIGIKNVSFYKLGKRSSKTVRFKNEVASAPSLPDIGSNDLIPEFTKANVSCKSYSADSPSKSTSSYYSESDDSKNQESIKFSTIEEYRSFENEKQRMMSLFIGDISSEDTSQIASSGASKEISQPFDFPTKDKPQLATASETEPTTADFSENIAESYNDEHEKFSINDDHGVGWDLIGEIYTNLSKIFDKSFTLNVDSNQVLLEMLHKLSKEVKNKAVGYQNSILKAEDEIAVLKGKVHEKEKEHLSSISEIESLKSELKTEKDSALFINKAVSDLRLEMNSSFLQLSKMQKELSKKEEDIALANEFRDNILKVLQLGDTSTDSEVLFVIKDFSSQISILQKEVCNMEFELSQSKADIADFKARYQELKIETENKEVELDNLKNQLEKERAKGRKIQNEAVSFKQQIADFQNTLEGTKKQLKNKEHELNDLKGRKDQIEKLMDQKEQNLLELREQLHKFTHQMEEADFQIQQELTFRTSLETTITRLKSNVNFLKRQNLEDLKDYEEKIELLKSQNTLCERATNEKKQELKILKDDISTLKDELVVKSSELSKMKSETKDYINDIQELSKENKYLRMTNAQLSDSFGIIKDNISKLFNEIRDLKTASSSYMNSNQILLRVLRDFFLKIYQEFKPIIKDNTDNFYLDLIKDFKNVSILDDDGEKRLNNITSFILHSLHGLVNTVITAKASYEKDMKNPNDMYQKLLFNLAELIDPDKLSLKENVPHIKRKNNFPQKIKKA